MAERAKTFTPAAFDRTRAVVLETEARRHGLAHDPQLAAAQTAGMAARGAARFRLVTPLEPGRHGIGRMLRQVKTDDPALYEWVPTAREEMLFAPGLATVNVLAEGTDVTAMPLAGGGWCVVTYELWGQLAENIFNDDSIDLTYAVCRVGGATVTSQGSDESNNQFATILQRPGDVPAGARIPSWDDDYAFTTGYDAGGDRSPRRRRDVHPDHQGASKVQMVPYVAQTPARVRYTPFDGTLSNGDPIPPSIVAAMGGIGEHPRPGELWHPANNCTLKRTLTFLELFWWEWCSPQWECRTFRESNPDYEFVWDEETSEYLDPDPDGNPRWIDKDYWALPVECTRNDTVHSGVECSEPPPDRRSAFWVAPRGWWGLHGWTWEWWVNRGWWWRPYGSPLLPYTSRWGPWGFRWWRNWWGGAPPTDDDLLELPTDQPPPDPPCGGLQQRYRYGFVVWDYGWRVSGVHEPSRTCIVSGDGVVIQNRLVVENPDVPQSSCSDGYD